MNHSVYLLDYYNCLIPVLRHFYAKGRNYRSICFAALFLKTHCIKRFFLQEHCVFLLNTLSFSQLAVYKIIKGSSSFSKRTLKIIVGLVYFLNFHCMKSIKNVLFSQSALHKIFKGRGYFVVLAEYRINKDIAISQSAYNNIIGRAYFRKSQCI